MTDAQRDRIEAEYTAAHVQALTLLENLHEIVEDLPAPGNDESPIHWGHVGDLNHTIGLLKQAQDFLAGK
jgi:hypothetical protein